MQTTRPTSPAAPLGGRYELRDPIGEGAFSVAYRAEDLLLGRSVAVKVLRARFVAEPAAVARFEREARVAASVSHPNVVEVFDVGTDRDTLYIVMQLVPGRTLRTELDRRQRFGPVGAVRIAGQVLRGLAAIHAAGIVHRDIKPQNVLLGDDGIVRVTDFGVAHLPRAEALTSHETTVGTASYMAPEQARGGGLSEATDLYAVGVLLFEMLTGRLPFVADNPLAVMLAHVQQAPPRPTEVAPEAAIPASLEREVLRALAKQPAQRPASAEEMATALEAAAGSSGDPPAIRAADGSSATTPLPIATIAGAAAPGRVPVALPGRPRRRQIAWLAPAVIFVLALVALGSLAVSGGFPGRGGNENDEPGVPAAIVDGTPSPTPSPPTAPTAAAPPPTQAVLGARTETASARLAPRPTRSPTAPPTRTRAPIVTPEPTPRPPPVPTRPPRPRTTRTPTPLPGVVDDAPVVAAEETAGDGAAAGPTIRFDVSDWRGAHAGDQDWYGRPWVAIYGEGSPYPRAVLSFDLPSQPTGRMELTVTGLGDESGRPFPFGIEINGMFAGQSPAVFPNWDPNRDGPHGEEADWSRLRIDIAAELLRKGRNEIAVVSLAPGATTDGPPYLLLGAATLAPADDVATLDQAEPMSVAAADDPGRDDRGRSRAAPPGKPPKSDQKKGRKQND